ncbi:MAG: hypothetical protein ACOC2W_00380 [bacterium]
MEINSCINISENIYSFSDEDLIYDEAAKSIQKNIDDMILENLKEELKEEEFLENISNINKESKKLDNIEDILNYDIR